MDIQLNETELAALFKDQIVVAAVGDVEYLIDPARFTGAELVALSTGRGLHLDGHVLRVARS